MKAFRYLGMSFIVALFFWACEEEAAIDEVSVSPATATIKKGETQQFTATVTDANGDTLTDATVEWVSSDGLIATVDEAGLATGVDAGDATINAAADGVSGLADLTVEKTVEEILLGTWTTSGGEGGLFLTTNSVQNAFNRFSQAEGVITIVGEDTDTLTYFFGFAEEDEGTIYFVGSSPIFVDLIEEEGFPLPLLVIFDTGPDESMMMVTTSPAPGDTVIYFASPPAYTYDKETGSLTIPSTVLTSFEGTGSVTVSGTLTYTSGPIPATTPTVVNYPFFDFEPEEAQTTITFAEDGIFNRISTFTDDEGNSGTGTGEGSWELLNDSSLLIIETITSEGEPSETDTSVIYFVPVSDYVVTIWFEEALCEDDEFESEAECLAQFEWFFGLDEGSLVTVVMRQTFTLQKEGGTSLARTGCAIVWKAVPDLDALSRTLIQKYRIR